MMKSIIYRFLALLYIGAMALAAIIMIKPGASIFYFKKIIDKQSIKPDSGFAYRFQLKVNPLIFRTQEVLLYEDGRQLHEADDKTVVDMGAGTYSLGKSSSQAAYIYFSSSNNSDPKTNAEKYTLYIPLNSVSHNNGIIYLEILLPGVIGFLLFVLTIPEQRKTLLKSPKGILQVLDHFFEYISQIFISDAGPVRQQIKGRALVWKQLFAVTVLAAFLYVFMEWVFFVTKLSFLSVLRPIEKVDVLILTGLALSCLSMLVLAVYIVMDLIAVFTRHSRITRYLGAILPTLLLSGLALILVDNFTYTVFRFGISTSAGIWRTIYGLLFFFLLIYIYGRMLKYFSPRGEKTPKRLYSNRFFYCALGILIISIIWAGSRLDFKKLALVNPTQVSQQARRYPNIILLGSDGLNAENLSVYGYKRDTTPRLRELAQSSLVAENAFSNFGESDGSVVSILTSKLPTTTRVGGTPGILTGLDAYQHLPGILKSEGYKTVEFGVPDYVDAYNVNIQNGFDIVNGRSQNTNILAPTMQKLGFSNAAYFLDSLIDRISMRILHIFYIRAMQNSYNLVTQPADYLSDEEKINQLLNLLDQSNEPVFVHLHLLDTHGDTFSPSVQVFSKGETQDQTWMVDFYDDAILSFDKYVGQVIDHLKANGQYENTILIIYTDHDEQWQVSKRIPLIIHFPADGYAGQITQNVQNLDIAPTILDYLGLPKPDWMGGLSLLKNNLDSQRLIFAMEPVRGKNSNGVWNILLENNPPFFQFDSITIIDCQKWYEFSLKQYGWAYGNVIGDTAPCAQQSLLNFDEIKRQMINRLNLDGFDTSSLP